MSTPTPDHEKIKSIYLRPSTADDFAGYAEDNATSMSEVVREAMQTFVSGNFPPPRKRRLRRITMWFPDVTVYAAFRKKCREEKITADQALSLVFEEMG